MSSFCHITDSGQNSSTHTYLEALDDGLVVVVEHAAAGLALGSQPHARRLDENVLLREQLRHQVLQVRRNGDTARLGCKYITLCHDVYAQPCHTAD